VCIQSDRHSPFKPTYSDRVPALLTTAWTIRF
jgi:hypothetical protein